MILMYTNWAKQQLRAIYSFYKDAGSPKKGRKIRVRVNNKILKLKDFPLLGREEELLAHLGQGHRYLVDGQYKIIYRIDNHIIYVTDIFDTRRNPDQIQP